MSKHYFDPKKYEPTLMDMLKYDVIKDERDNVIYKDMGDYVQMIIPANNSKGHDTYNIYMDENDHIIKVEGHSGNSGFTGTKTF